MLDFVLPETLAKYFSVKLFGRGAAMDEAQGDPQKVWKIIHKKASTTPLIAPHQVHGTAVLKPKMLYALPLRPKADGVFLKYDSPVCASLRFADCTPVVVAGTSPVPWLFILHSGYVGTVKNIAENALIREMERGNIDTAGEMWAWIAPSICSKCYSRKKKGDPSTRKGLEVFSPENWKESGDFIFFDIQSQIANQLEAAGLSKEHIYTMRRCTHCENDLFYSYRGGDAASRNFLLAYATNVSL